MELTPEELPQNGYVLMDSLAHKEIVPFVRKYMRKRTRFSIVYMIANTLAAALVVVVVWTNYAAGRVIISDSVTHFSYGIGLAFLLVPLHEYLHVLAFKKQGAKQTSYDANLKKFYFMAIANRFVANRKEFQVVALAPVTLISAALLAGCLFTTPLWTVTLLGILLTHTAFCSGDFALLSYFNFHKDMAVVTYDDKEKGLTFFYGKPS